jgi:hypothetical protein
MRKIEPEADGILKDGQMLRVPHTMMDALSRDVARHPSGQPFVADHHRPRSGTLTDDQRNAAIERQKAYDNRVSNAWKGADAGAPALLTPDRTTPTNAADLDALQAANERRHAAKISEAWRNPVNQGVK